MASGDTLVILDPLQNIPPATAYATLDMRNGHAVLDFNASTDSSAVFKSVLPRNYAGGGVTVYPHFAMTSATTGSVVIDIAFERIGDGQQDIDSDGFAAVQSATIAVPGTSGNVEASTGIAFTDGAQMDSVAAGEEFRIKVTRDANHASDDAAGDMELTAIEIKET